MAGNRCQGVLNRIIAIRDHVTQRVCMHVCVFQTHPDNILEFLLTYKIVGATVYRCSSVCVCERDVKGGPLLHEM